ncbi:MAG TPA: DUF4388 domain-containing protein [Thermoanaerobaculia bacterium]|nr:DUF4388 domain-containing protein [Thermoanaerobaculia bacterium]
MAVLQGDASAFRLPDVLAFLSTTRKSGTLTFANGGREAHLFFDDGALVYASSNQEGFRLGQILLRKKKITRDQRDRIDALMQRDGGQFGRLCVDSGVLTDPELRDALKVQVSEIVFDAFVWNAGVFSFEQETALPSHAVTISIDLGNLIMEGARRIEEWEQCLQLLPDQSMIFRVVATPRDEKITLTADEWKILFMINGQRTIKELCDDSEDDPFQVYRLLYGLRANKLIEVAGERRLDDTGAGPPSETGTMAADATIRQGAPRFGSESTIQDEPNDDTSLLMQSEERLLSYADVVRPTVAQLRMERDGTIIPLTEPEYLIGRHRENTIQLNDLGVSGFHARIYRGPEGYVIEDLKSRNGTWLNGARVYHAILSSGDRIHVGQLDLDYEVLFA